MTRVGLNDERSSVERVTVDPVIFTVRDGALQVLLVRRGIEPFLGQWAVPGGFVRPDESLDDAARRELLEETGLTNVWLEQLFSFGDPDRDPRGRVITIAYFALVSPDRAPPFAGGDAADARWWPIDSLPLPLAFDHSSIVDMAIQRLRGKLSYTNIVFELLPKRFTMAQLQSVHETILGEKLDKRNFRKRIEALGVLRPLKQSVSGTAGRPAQLYSFESDTLSERR